MLPPCKDATGRVTRICWSASPPPHQSDSPIVTCLSPLSCDHPSKPRATRCPLALLHVSRQSIGRGGACPARQLAPPDSSPRPTALHLPTHPTPCPPSSEALPLPHPTPCPPAPEALPLPRP